jgi:hypothetical protein
MMLLLMNPAFTPHSTKSPGSAFATLAAHSPT